MRWASMPPSLAWQTPLLPPPPRAQAPGSRWAVQRGPRPHPSLVSWGEPGPGRLTGGARGR